MAGFEGERPGGEFGFPAPSGKRRIRIQAPGFRTREEPLDLDPAVKERKLEYRLLPE